MRVGWQASIKKKAVSLNWTPAGKFRGAMPRAQAAMAREQQRERDTASRARWLSLDDPPAPS
jgi:hypothetical protein